MFQTKFVEKIKSTLCSIYFFFFEIVPRMRYVQKHCSAGQNTEGNMALAPCTLGT